MSVANGFNRVEARRRRRCRRCAANVTTALRVLTRPARIRHARAPMPLRAARRWRLLLRIAVAVFLLLAWTLDAAAIRGVGHLPRWIMSFSTTSPILASRAGSSGRSVCLFLALAALPPALAPISQRVLAAIMVRVGFLFAAIAVPSLFVTIVKRMIGRARPNVGGSLDPSLFSPFEWARGLCRHAVRPCHHGVRRAGGLRHAVAARPHGTADLCAVDRGEPRGGDAHYPTDVWPARWSGWRRDDGAALFRAAPAWFCDRAGRHVHQYPGPSLRRIKAVAREPACPIRHRRHDDNPIRRCPSWCRSATRPAISRRWSRKSPPRSMASGRSRSSTSMTARPTRPRPSSRG